MRSADFTDSEYGGGRWMGENFRKKIKFIHFMSIKTKQIWKQ